MDTGLTATVRPPKFDHLLGLTDRRGAFEHETAGIPAPESTPAVISTLQQARRLATVLE
jgi:hypothetical protein